MEEEPKSAAAATATATASNKQSDVKSLLSNLPFRGNFSSSTILPFNPGGTRKYICEHDTSPPVGQLITTNQQNILIRALIGKKQKSDAILKDAKGKAKADNSKGKRTADRPAEGRSSAKRANITLDSRSSRQDGSSSRTEKDYQSLTVERLRGILKERGLSTKGRKDELIARLRGGRGDKEA